MQKSLTALAAAAMLAGVGYAAAQTTDTQPADSSMTPQSAPMPADNSLQPQPQSTTTTTTAPADTSTSATTSDPSPQPQTTTTTTTDTQTQVIPAPPTGVTPLAKPKGTVTATDKQDNGTLGSYNNVMTSGVTDGATRPSVGDHATPPIQAAPTEVNVTTERTTTTTTTPAPAPEPQAAPAPEPAPEAAPEPMPAPRSDRN
jgi:hypothetical protein